jgi:cell division protein FtsW (lipid II flippase)
MSKNFEGIVGLLRTYVIGVVGLVVGFLGASTIAQATPNYGHAFTCYEFRTSMGQVIAAVFVIGPVCAWWLMRYLRENWQWFSIAFALIVIVATPVTVGGHLLPGPQCTPWP